MDTVSFTFHIKTEDIYVDITKDVETRIGTWNYELEIPLPKGKNLKIIQFMKNELGGKIMTEFAAWRPKIYSYLTNDNNENKRSKGKKSVSLTEN